MLWNLVTLRNGTVYWTLTNSAGIAAMIVHGGDTDSYNLSCDEFNIYTRLHGNCIDEVTDEAAKILQSAVTDKIVTLANALKVLRF